MQFVKSERNIKVTINDSLDWESVHTLLQQIHFHECQEKFWKVPLYCKPIRTLTPAKSNGRNKNSASAVIENLPVSGSSNILLQSSKSTPSANKTDMSVSDYDFCDLVVVETPKNIAKSDNQKRKTVSPIEQE